tara:strand:- start:275 stop:1201 length:927 start_codon:yes stop_codon:yes gene_type:complete
MKKIYLWPAQGFGDAICLNALIRNICNDYDSVSLFCSEHFYKSIKWMLRDVENLNFISVPYPSHSVWEDCIRSFIIQNNLKVYELTEAGKIKSSGGLLESDSVIKLGIHNDLAQFCRSVPEGSKNLDHSLSALPTDSNLVSFHTEKELIPFYESYYMMYDLPVNYRFSHFYYERDMESENFVLNSLNPNNEKYIFVIEDGKHRALGRSVCIPEDKLPTQYKIIRYNKELNYNDDRFICFNYYKLLENAEQIHTTETAFFEFIRSMSSSLNTLPSIKKSKVYLHSYVRNYITTKIDKEYNRLLSKGVSL